VGSRSERRGVAETVRYGGTSDFSMNERTLVTTHIHTMGRSD